ncbi:DUF4132 domain-containing protein [Spongiactinospora sp. TRM90649]|uniref:DUF4132 domain-containing protein n=1 Tax=Spongiactinospora sp. TRM90649 TaxID=3031114 RepID=UPI0023F987DC|nr:DUF4132 domain-containing protein [Spongiactinospora sp. TRM90649]MDF5754175.1 DUF4132 domain-containing protein [Spongiactinospora sp. TRM90649]
MTTDEWPFGGTPLEHAYWAAQWAVANRERYTRLDEAHAAGVPVATLTAGYGEADWRFLGMWAQARLDLGWDGGHDHDPRALEATHGAADRELEWTAEEASILWDVADRLMMRAHTHHRELYRLPLAAVARLGYPDRRAVLYHARSWYPRYWKDAWEVLRDPVEELLTEPEESDPAAAVRNVMWEDDHFAAALITDFAPRLASPEALPLLRHWQRATQARPSERWLAKARELVRPGTGALLRDVLGLIPAHRAGEFARFRYGRRHTEVLYLSELTAVPLRGMLWTCELIDEPWVTTLLGDIAVATGVGDGGSKSVSRSELLANAAIGVLGRRGDLAGVAQLARVLAKVRRKTVLACADKALAAVAGHTGLSPEQLLDRTVPTFGLGPDGTRTEHGLRLSLTGAIEYVDGGKVRKSIPKAVRAEHPELLAELKTTAKELRSALPAERFRVERALAGERIWRWRDVREFFLDHPVTGHFGRSLIWRVLQGPAGLPVRAGDGWELADPAGRRIQPEPETPVLLWHPIGASVEEVKGWRDHLIEIGLRQPFKQAFREIYLLTPAEETARDHSGRFAGHILRYGQAKALLTERGWTGLTLGHWDAVGGSHYCEARRELPGLTAWWGFHLDYENAERDGYGTASTCVSENIRFTDEGDGGGVPLAEVDPLVLSEVLRDADLAVGVTSTGLDPRGEGDYWRDYSFGDLSETAVTRRDALVRLLPRLAIRDRAEVTGRFLRVRGDLRTYKIHLGSGNILMEPNDAYLCVVPGGTGMGRVFLPFEEDGGMLSVVLSKAFLLAADTEITDPTITRQLGV